MKNSVNIEKSTVKNVRIVFNSSINNLQSINSSFDKGILRIAYWGKNRNKSFISKESFEKCAHTMFNCPIVCNYNRELDSIGAHDIDVVSTDDCLKLVNITQPVGVVPESANYWWETVEESDGTTHEYLCAEILIWKRQEAYEKIKNNGITDESMEISVKSGGMSDDGYYHINDFEFTAFCLLESAEPCFESACIEMFSLNIFRDQYAKMLDDFKQISSKEEFEIDIRNINKKAKEGGCKSMGKEKLLTKYGFKSEDLKFDVDSLTYEELEAKLQEMTSDTKGKTDVTESVNSDVKDDEQGKEFSLTTNDLIEALYEALSLEKYNDPDWGECTRYWYVDSDITLSEVYCYDTLDWNLYGFNFRIDGDSAIIDFETKKRKKYTIVDFDEGDSSANYSVSLAKSIDSFKSKYVEKCNDLTKFTSELEELREFKLKKFNEDVKALFLQFAELSNIEEFEELKNNYSSLTLEEIENKCYAILGRFKKANSTYSLEVNRQTTRLPIEKNQYDNEPYGGLFVKYKN